MEKNSLAALCFFLIIMFCAEEMIVQTEAKRCEVLADTYKGPCFWGCDVHCTTKEHYISGRCRDDHRCWCTKNC
ncbi:hypothetical protein L6164_000923 [Bauhinia variegata]|uniref:Uncharacterized protein n=1 Tax=Bauhinia variegata TaxID=167791 RepID=A0ACB9QA45_BAUVA|nr:hypothetical protein L6164_000923 [Bauhinia variegata]